MATKYLAEGATTFASPAWSGGAIADTNDLVISYPFGIVSAGLDQSALTEGIASLWIKPGATAGRIGGGAAGSFIVDADVTTGSFVANYGNVELYLTAGGDESLIQNVDSGAGTTNLTGGTVTNVTSSGGVINANASTVITNLVGVGGSGTIEYNATAITAAEFYGGFWTIKRAVTSLTVSGNAVVVYDPDDAATLAGTTINTKGGRLIHRAGATPTIANRGGVHDFSQARISFTPGGTAWTFIGTKFVDSATVATTNRSRLYGSVSVEGGLIPL